LSVTKIKALKFNCACYGGEPESRVSVVTMDKSNSGGHQAVHDEFTADQQSSAAAKSPTPRHAVRFAESSRPPPLEVTAGVDIHDAGVSSTPPDSANSVSAVEKPQQPAAGARSVTARILTPPGKGPRSVAV